MRGQAASTERPSASYSDVCLSDVRRAEAVSTVTFNSEGKSTLGSEAMHRCP